MSDVAVSSPLGRTRLDANAVLKEAWALYRRLFGRSVLLGAVVLGAVHLLEALAGVSQSGAAVSLLAGLGIGLAALLLVVPGVILATRWALAVPVAMLEDCTARGALSRSRELVRGNGWSVFKVLVAVGILTALVDVPFTLAAAGAGPFGWWLGATTASALTAPYAAHALTVAYYKLVDPGRPVVLEPGSRWASVWDEEPDDDANGES